MLIVADWSNWWSLILTDWLMSDESSCHADADAESVTLESVKQVSVTVKREAKGLQLEVLEF